MIHSIEYWKKLLAPQSQGGYLGAPFEWGARGPNTFDCWGLVLAIREKLNLETPDEWAQIDNDFSYVTKTMMVEIQTSNWKQLSDPQHGCITMLSKNKAYHHAGIYTPWGIFHTSKGFGAVIQELSTIKRNGYNLIHFYEYIGA